MLTRYPPPPPHPHLPYRRIRMSQVAALSDVPVVMEVAVGLLESVTGEKVKPLVCGEKCQDVWAHESLDFF